MDHAAVDAEGDDDDEEVPVPPPGMMGDSDRNLISSIFSNEEEKEEVQAETETDRSSRATTTTATTTTSPMKEDYDEGSAGEDDDGIVPSRTPNTPTSSYYHLYAASNTPQSATANSSELLMQQSMQRGHETVTDDSDGTLRRGSHALTNIDNENENDDNYKSGSNPATPATTRAASGLGGTSETAAGAAAASAANAKFSNSNDDTGIGWSSSTRAASSNLSEASSSSELGSHPPRRSEEEMGSSQALLSPVNSNPTTITAASTTTDSSLAADKSTAATNTHISVSSRDQVQTSESKKSKIVLRVMLGAVMFGLFGAFVYMGHLYVSGLVALIELLLFRELVRVRYNAHFDKIQNRIPFFRTTQWCWFVLSIVYTYGDFVYDVIQSNPRMHHLNRYLQYLSTISFVLYSGVFVLTISTLQPGYIKFQMNQLCWTTLVICLTVGQLKYVFHNIYNGLIWFVLPCCLVFTNDIAAYVTGMTWGRKFIQRKFLALSPNKTWEGFIGGFVCTMLTAWYLAKILAQFNWMTCPTNRFTTEIHAPLRCTPDPIFLEAQSYVPSQIFELLPDVAVKLIPGVVDICLVKSGAGVDGLLAASATATTTGAGMASSEAPSGTLLAGAASSAAASVLGLAPGERLTPCVSGAPNQIHHHFEFTMKNHYPIQVHALWLGLFASLVAPFGGFLASAMKRAYGIKDFDSLIPGHGGVMDRMDCQFLMALCTWVHYNTFVKLATVSVPRLTYLYGMLTDQEKVDFIKSIANPKAKIRFEDFA